MYGNKGTSSAEHCVTLYLRERVHRVNPLLRKTWDLWYRYFIYLREYIIICNKIYHGG